MTRASRFDDGPKTGAVSITTVSLFDTHGQRVSSATFRKGRELTAVKEVKRPDQPDSAWVFRNQRVWVLQP